MTNPPPQARWVGIDEAGYGPNLGPLVMTMVVAESSEDRPLDLWNDLSGKVGRARSDRQWLWVDDSKSIYKAGQGRDRLEAVCLALLQTLGKPCPASLGGLLEAFGAGSLRETELELWLDKESDVPFPQSPHCWEAVETARSFQNDQWRIVAVKCVVVGPSRFNLGLAKGGANKATVHFQAFRTLLEAAWNRATDGVTTRIHSDKHGGRHFYQNPLVEALPDAWIDRGPEGPALSQYVARSPGRRLEVSFRPRADANDGLVALASIVSKTVRELWMDVFNAYWTGRIPGLKPTAGYPVDALRFRDQICDEAKTLGLEPECWWRPR